MPAYVGKDSKNYFDGVKYVLINESSKPGDNGKIHIPDSAEFVRIDNPDYEIDYFPLDLKRIFVQEYGFDLPQLPASLEEFVSHTCVNGITFPDNMKKLELINNTHKINIPANLRELYLNNYKYAIDIPATLKKLSLSQYNRSDLKLPDGLEELTLKKYSHTGLRFPASLRSLTLYSMPEIKQQLGDMDYLKIGNCRLFNFPRSVKTLVIGYGAVLPSNKIPAGVKKLVLETYPFNIELNPDLKKLDVIGNWKKISSGEIELPAGLEKLEMMLHNIPGLTRTILPAGLKTLILFDYNQPDLYIPPGLKKLTLFQYNQPGLIDKLPETIEYLNLGVYKHPIPKLPNNIETLILNSYVSPAINLKSTPIKQLKLLKYNTAGLKLPVDLRDLELGEYNHPDIVEQLPPDLENLLLYNYSNKNILPFIKNSKLKHIEVKIDIPPENLPAGLVKIK